MPSRTIILAPLLRGEPAEIVDRRSPFESPEIDDLERAAVDQPVSGLPIPVGGNDVHWPRAMSEKYRPQPLLIVWRDSMRLIKPGNRFRDRGGIPIRIGAFGLLMECPAQLAGLDVGIRQELGIVSLD